MDEYALRFYALIEQSIKLDARESKDRILTHIAAVAGDDTRKAIMEEYDHIGYDIIEDLLSSSNISSHEEVKKAING